MGPRPTCADESPFVGTAELVKLLAVAPGHSDRAVNQAQQILRDGPLTVLCAPSDVPAHDTCVSRRCGGARSEAGGKRSLPFGQYGRDVGALAGHRGAVGVLAE